MSTAQDVLAPPAELDRRVRARFTALLARAAEELAALGLPPLPTPRLHYFDHRLDAGRALPPARVGAAGTVELNTAYLRRHPEEMLEETVAHELAHLVVFHLNPQRRQPPHGAVWQRVMQEWFGVEPERTHRFDASVVPARRQRRWRYRCGCREHELTTVRHRRVAKGARYLCRACREVLAFTGDMP
ncbi:MAG: SprT-like domain-containing protein [Pseudomonadales bacterium]|nr:SprT-like domain-containing protein [Pseudomonadales bacterium]